MTQPLQNIDARSWEDYVFLLEKMQTYALLKKKNHVIFCSISTYKHWKNTVEIQYLPNVKPFMKVWPENAWNLGPGLFT